MEKPTQATGEGTSGARRGRSFVLKLVKCSVNTEKRPGRRGLYALKAVFNFITGCRHSSQLTAEPASLSRTRVYSTRISALLGTLALVPGGRMLGPCATGCRGHGGGGPGGKVAGGPRGKAFPGRGRLAFCCLLNQQHHEPEKQHPK